jgi:hypothetical protein
MNMIKPALVSMLILMATACSWQQVGQGVYDSAKSDECMRKTGKLQCDLNE